MHHREAQEREENLKFLKMLATFSQILFFDAVVVYVFQISPGLLVEFTTSEHICDPLFVIIRL